jgi:tetratricopeptide (TPR) repeat protein
MIQTYAHNGEYREAWAHLTTSNSKGQHLASGFRILLMAALFSSPFSLAAAAENLPAPCASQDAAGQAKSAGTLLGAGNAFFDSGQLQKAEDAWTEARNCSRTAPAWPKATYNLGVLRMKQAKYSQAISYFNEVLGSHANDKEPGEDIMEPYRNYSHRSALEISVCYEKMDDNLHALEYAWLARIRYPFVSWCGTCLEFENLDQNKRIASLFAKAFGMPFFASIVLAGAFLSMIRTKKA